MVSIIGAGPAGLYSAYLLGKKGYDASIYEQKKIIGNPVQCTGIVTSKISSIIRLPENVIQNKIKNIKINSDNNSAELRLKQPDIVLDRAGFDLFLKQKALDAGAGLFTGHKLLDVGKESIMIKNIPKKRKQSVKTDYIIGADGPLSVIYNKLNPENPRRYYYGIQVRAEGNFDKETFEVFLGSVCPDFFAWLVPEDSEIARIGLASMQNPKLLLKKLLQKLKIKKAMEIQAGLIPLYDPKIKTNLNNTCLVGDAAAQIKASTGGGIIQGLTAAKCLASSVETKCNYEKIWRKELGKDLRLHLKLRQCLNKFTAKDYDRLVKMINRDKLKNILENESRDIPSEFLIKMLLAEPGLVSFAGKLF
ncbi:geranylgeranyl reductase family protein [Candidatus Woesearchaeota archaeon]|nr:geranylgeranyl reductase family protein [Candidatus Woesearchaeota archaeon]